MRQPSPGETPSSDVPINLLSDDAFLQLRTLLAEHGFTDRGVRAHTGTESLFDFSPGKHARSGTTPVEQPLDVLVRLFMDSESLTRAVVEAQLGADAYALLVSFGLLATHPERTDECVATVLMYPTVGPWLVSDRAASIGGTAGRKATADNPLAGDVVYPALTMSVRAFLSTLPTGPVDDYLELCSGTGVAALMGAATGTARAVAVDITARSTAFADFNARLNGLANVTALEGDLYQPVAGRTFDVIVAHPPYVPSTGTEYIYRDGGDDGEQITRAILGGLADHLAPRGVFHCTCIISSRAGEPAAHRVRTMLGDASAEFDMVFLRNGTARMIEQLRKELMSPDDRKQREARIKLQRFEELRVESVDFCTIVLRRHGASRRGFSIAVERTGDTVWDHVAWSLAIAEAALETDTFTATVLDSRIQLSPAARLDVAYRAGGSGEEPWVAEGGRLSVAVPYVAEVKVGMGDATMLARFDGTRTLREQLAQLQSEGALPAEVDADAFAQSFSQLVLDGIVLTEAFPLP